MVVGGFRVGVKGGFRVDFGWVYFGWGGSRVGG